MKKNCDCCSREFKVANIRCIVPVIIDNKIQEFHLCRPCFIVSDEMTFTKFMDFMAKGGITVKSE